MATPKKDTAKAASDSQAQMTSFVQRFARPAAAPVIPAPEATEPELLTPDLPAAEPKKKAAPEPQEIPVAATPVEEAEIERPATSGKKKPAAPLASAAEEPSAWADAYLQPVRTRKTKAIYVDEETHATLALLTQEAGIGLADLLINITNNHFDTFRLEIREFLAERERLKKKKFRF